MFDLTKPADIGQTLLVTLIGMATVILGLTILIFLIKALIKVTDNLGAKKKKKMADSQVVIPPVKAFGTPAEEPEIAEDDSLVAVITAAIVWMMEESQGFVVRRIRRV